MFINRDWNRTEHDDFELNVNPKLNGNLTAVPWYVEGEMVGWKLIPSYE
jgi:hypothetical protein